MSSSKVEINRSLLAIAVLLLLVLLGASCAKKRADVDYALLSYSRMPESELYERGMRYYQSGRTDSTIMMLSMVAQRDTSSIDEETRKVMILSRNMLGVINFLQSNYQEAYTHFLKAADLDNVPDAGAYRNLATLFLHYGDKPRAFEYLKNYVRYAVAKGHWDNVNLGIANILTTDYVDAGVPVDTIDDLVNLYLQQPPQVSQCKSFPLASNLAMAWKLGYAGEHLEAIGHIRHALTELDTLLDDRGRHALYIVAAKEYALAGSRDSSVNYLDMAESLARANNYKELMAKSYAEASRIYDSFGDKEASTRYHHLMLEMNDSLFNPRELGKIHDLKTYYEIDKFETRMHNMTEHYRLRTIILWIVSAVLLVVTAFMYIFWRQNRELRFKSKSLFEHKLREIETQSQPKVSHVDESASDDSAAAEHPLLTDTVAEDSQDAPNGKYANSNLNDQSRRRIKRLITEVFADESVFCKDGFTLSKLAELCNSNSRYVSQVINEEFGKSFPQYLNEKRVDVACRRFLDNENYGHLKLEAIIESLGFKSRSTFSKTFKRITGLSPSEFRSMSSK